MNLIKAAHIIADKYHNQIMGQKRKYTGEPYTVHTDEVERIYAEYFPEDTIGRAAAKAHDLVEDCPLTSENLREELLALGVINNSDLNDMIQTVVDLTDIFTKETYPNLNRTERKKLERERLGMVSIRSKNLKVCDLISNTASIVEHDKGFAKTYIKEKIAMLPYLIEGDYTLLTRATQQVVDASRILNIPFRTIS